MGGAIDWRVAKRTGRCFDAGLPGVSQRLRPIDSPYAKLYPILGPSFARTSGGPPEVSRVLHCELSGAESRPAAAGGPDAVSGIEACPFPETREGITTEKLLEGTAFPTCKRCQVSGLDQILKSEIAL